MSKAWDKIIISIAVFYIVVPIILFLFGWLKLPIAILISLLLLIFAIRIIRSVEIDESISFRQNKRFWLTSLVLIALWVMFSGIGSFSYQTTDFVVRNPMFTDLRIYNWPVMYDLSLETEEFLKFVGESNSALYVYYFTWWLPAALFSKLLNLIGFGNHQYTMMVMSNIVLYLWAVLGLLLVLYCLVRYFKKYSYWITASLILFGGFDFVIYVFRDGLLPFNRENIEWWSNLFQYSSNTTQLYWVFNQSIPTWLIVSLFLVMKNKKCKAGWCSLCFAYSPYATIGLIPIAIVDAFVNKEEKLKTRVKTFFSLENMIIPLCMFISYAFFYLMDMQGEKLIESYNGFIIDYFLNLETVSIYILFIMVEIGAYLWIMGKTAIKYRYYWIVLIELLLLPFYRQGMNSDFTMRASIAPLFLFMVNCLTCLFEFDAKKNIKYKKYMMIAMTIGFLTSCTEIQRNVSKSLYNPDGPNIDQSVYSFGLHLDTTEKQIKIDIDQYMVLDDIYEDSFFYNHLMRQ